MFEAGIEATAWARTSTTFTKSALNTIINMSVDAIA